MATFTECANNNAGIPGADGVASISCLEPLFVNIVNAVIALTGIALFFMIVVSGFNFLFSGGDPKKLEQARQSLTYSVIGLIIIATAYLIIRTIASFTGIEDILHFKINTTLLPGTYLPLNYI